MSIKTGIDETRKLYENKIFGILKNREKSKLTELRLWPMFEEANIRGFYLVEPLLNCIDHAERFIDARKYLNAFFDFISPVEACILLTGSSLLIQYCDSDVKTNNFGAIEHGLDYLSKNQNPISGKKYNCPSEKTFCVGKLADRVNPQCLMPGESAKSIHDYKILHNRRQQWEIDCGVIFDAVWRDSKLWSHLLDIGFKHISDYKFSDHGVDFISAILAYAKRRGFLYESFFVNELKLSGNEKSELSDCFTRAILLFISPAELYKILEVEPEFFSGKHSKLRDPKLIKL